MSQALHLLGRIYIYLFIGIFFINCQVISLQNCYPVNFIYFDLRPCLCTLHEHLYTNQSLLTSLAFTFHFSKIIHNLLTAFVSILVNISKHQTSNWQVFFVRQKPFIHSPIAVIVIAVASTSSILLE